MSKEALQKKKIEQAVKDGANAAKTLILHELRNILSCEEQSFHHANVVKDKES